MELKKKALNYRYVTVVMQSRYLKKKNTWLLKSQGKQKDIQLYNIFQEISNVFQRLFRFNTVEVVNSPNQSN